MKTFIKWCEEEKLNLPPVDENRVRTGITANYPDAYVRAQYPHKWFNPHKATTDLDLQQKPAKGYAGPRAAN
jgi:hypothetical protein